MTYPENEFEKGGPSPVIGQQRRDTRRKVFLEQASFPRLSREEFTVSKLAQRAKLDIKALPSGAFEEDRSDGQSFVAQGVFNAVVSVLVLNNLAARFVGNRYNLFQLHRSDLAVAPKSRVVKSMVVELTFAKEANHDFREFASFLDANRHCFPPEMSKLHIRIVGMRDFRDETFVEELVPVITIRAGKAIQSIQRSIDKISLPLASNEAWFCTTPDLTQLESNGSPQTNPRSDTVKDSFKRFCDLLAGVIASRVVSPR